MIVVSRRARSAPFGDETVVSRRDGNQLGLKVVLGKGGRPTIGWVQRLPDSPGGRVRLATPAP